MSPDLDSGLMLKYPKIFQQRGASFTRWGFECDDGWYDIIDSMCACIQQHVDHTRKARARALIFNRAVSYAMKGDMSRITSYFLGTKSISNASRYTIEQLDKITRDPLSAMKKVPDACPQVVARQVKEKFGDLRFYYDGGDEYVSGIVTMACTFSSTTCERCGKPGEKTRGGWIRVLCEDHREP